LETGMRERRRNDGIPDSGEPMTHPMPWNSAQNPNALVSF